MDELQNQLKKHKRFRISQNLNTMVVIIPNSTVV